MTRHYDRDHEPFTTDVRFTEGGTPATPATGQRKIYATSDGFHEIDDTGTIRSLDSLNGVTLTGVPSAGATIIATSATTAQWATGGAVTIYWPMLALSSQV